LLDPPCRGEPQSQDDPADGSLLSVRRTTSSRGEKSSDPAPSQQSVSGRGPRTNAELCPRTPPRTGTRLPHFGHVRLAASMDSEQGQGAAWAEADRPRNRRAGWFGAVIYQRRTELHGIMPAVLGAGSRGANHTAARIGPHFSSGEWPSGLSGERWPLPARASLRKALRATKESAQD